MRTAGKFRKGCTVLRVNLEMIEKIRISQYCPKDFCPGLKLERLVAPPL